MQKSPKILYNCSIISMEESDAEADAKLKERRLPTAEDLDKAGVSKPVWLLRTDGNACSINSNALKEVVFSNEDFSVEKDPSGQATGIFKVPSNFAIRSQVFNQNSMETKKRAVLWAAEKALSFGITSLHGMEYLEDLAGLKETFDNFPVKAVLYGRSDDLDKCAALGLKRVAGDVLLDGTFGCYTAALFSPYTDKPEERGVLYYEKRMDFLYNLMERVKAEGLQSGLHAIGDRGIETALELFEHAFGRHPSHPINQRIEHFTLPTEKQLDRTARLGAMVSLGPSALLPNCSPGGTYLNRLGPERARKTLPFRLIFDRGIIAGANSDSPVYDMNPLLGIHSVVNAPFETQRINLKEALTLYTINPAKICFMEDRIGSIKVGKSADLAVLDRNPFDVPKGEIKEIKVKMTFVDGEMRYKAESL